MRYRVELYPSDEGFAVSCPRLPGCWSQGATEDEALENIRVAIQEYLSSQLPDFSTDRLDHLYVQVFVEGTPPPVRGETLARMRRVLASLPARDIEVLRAVFVDELDRTEVARKLGIDEGYLRILLQRATEKFRRMYVEDEAALGSPTTRANSEQNSSEVREVEVAV